MRLVGGDAGVGRLELKRKETETWGSVCMDGWKPVNSEVVCRELCGYVGSQVYRAFTEFQSEVIWSLCVSCLREGANAEMISANSISSPPPLQFTNVRCIGIENSITECQMFESSAVKCNTRQRVGVSCVQRSCSAGTD